MTTDGLRIVFALESHIYALASLERETLAEPYDSLTLRRLINGRCSGRVVELGELPIAYLLWQPGDGRLAIRRLVVDRPWQRQGLGSLLLRDLRDRQTHSVRHREIVADVPERRCDLEAFFRANGYRAALVRDARGGDDTYRFSMPLEKPWSIAECLEESPL